MISRVCLTAWVGVTLITPALDHVEVKDWQVLACTSEEPLDFRHEPMTFFFKESGTAKEAGGAEVDARVNPAEIFVAAKEWTLAVSRVTGRFSYQRHGDDGMTTLRVTGSCVTGAPKF